VAVVFLFQLYGIELGFAELLVVVITATLAAVGAAGIPSAGLIMMVIVIRAVNTSLGDPTKELPLEAIGVIIGVDRIVDMCRTTVNVWGDAVGAKIMTRLAPDTGWFERSASGLRPHVPFVLRRRVKPAGRSGRRPLAPTIVSFAYDGVGHDSKTHDIFSGDCVRLLGS